GDGGREMLAVEPDRRRVVQRPAANSRLEAGALLASERKNGNQIGFTGRGGSHYQPQRNHEQRYQESEAHLELSTYCVMVPYLCKTEETACLTSELNASAQHDLAGWRIGPGA